VAEPPIDQRPPVSGQTLVAAVIGSPIGHSLSPTLLNAAFAATGLDWLFVAADVAPGDAARALDGMRALGLGGLSVTMPHKDDVAALVDDCTPAAMRLGAVNCVVPDGDRLIGHNTDGGGFLDGLVADTGLHPSGLRVVVLGAGGAARAVVDALGTAGAAEVTVVNRTAARAEATAALAGPVGRVGGPETVAEADLVVNATSVGMAGDPGLPVDVALLHPGQVAVDLIYHPLETPWVAALRERGVEAHHGLSMLLHQAARAFTLWTGQAAPVDAMAAAARAALAGR
jgi:shikimate dehydrogenase